MVWRTRCGEICMLRGSLLVFAMIEGCGVVVGVGIATGFRRVLFIVGAVGASAGVWSHLRGVSGRFCKALYSVVLLMFAIFIRRDASAATLKV